MAITVKIGSDAVDNIQAEQPEKPAHDPVTIELQITKTLDGNIVISDHPDVDIVVNPKENNIVAF